MNKVYITKRANIYTIDNEPKEDESDTDSDDEDMESIVAKNIVLIEQEEIQKILQKEAEIPKQKL